MNLSIGLAATAAGDTRGAGVSGSAGTAPPTAAAPRRLAVRRVSLSQFRCYEGARLRVGPAPVVVVGPNGAGKTALLEALSLLSPGRGLRRARLDEINRLGQSEPWTVSASLDGPLGPIEIGTGLKRAETASPARAGGRRLVRIDGKMASGAGDLAAAVALVWLTPAMDRLFQEGAAGRRRFLDRLALAFVPEHAQSAASYDKAMRERNRLLREPGQADRRWLGALEERMVLAGIALAAARCETIAGLEQAFAAEGGAGSFPAARLGVEGRIEGWLGEANEDVTAERFRAALADGRSKDRAAGQTLIGPHRSDLRVRHAASGMAAELCSTGEQKALLIAILLAETRWLAVARGMVPLLLLDEVAAHLDAGQRAALGAALAALGAQAWMTGTELEPFEAMAGGMQFIAVRDGRIEDAGEIPG